jgi:hypothetical protein
MRVALAAVAAAVAVGAAAGATSATRLQITGAFATSSAKTVAGRSECTWGAGRLTFVSGDMRVGGPFVARVLVTLPSFHGVGRYNAVTPRVAGAATPVQVYVVPTGSSKAPAVRYLATRGTVRVDAFRSFGENRTVSAAGAITARLAAAGSGIRVSGTWSCTSSR